MRLIETRYLPPTNTRGARIRATDLATGVRKVTGYDHSAVNAHRAAAIALAAQEPWNITSAPQAIDCAARGYVWVFGCAK